MKFRVARHTGRLDEMTDFYVSVIGLDQIGSFSEHVSYSGSFLGRKDSEWELELTNSEQPPRHQPDEDDLLVFYFYSDLEIESVRKNAVKAGAPFGKPRNPYWQLNGFLISDPDGFGTIVTKEERKLHVSKNQFFDFSLTQVSTWEQLLHYIHHLPYGRNARRDDFNLVLTEGKGTCSSKHALVKLIADANGIEAELVNVIYRMNECNSPGIGKALENFPLNYIPESHVCLKVNGQFLDLTFPESSGLADRSELLFERTIGAEDVISEKVEFHKKFIKIWIEKERIALSFDEVWKIRESCIGNLSIQTS